MAESVAVAQANPSGVRIVIDPDGYRPNVGIVLMHPDGRVFWARRVRRDGWQFPQGGMNTDETPLEAMYRELREETGLDVEPQEFLGVWMDVYGESGETTLNLYWVCRASGEPEPADDIDGVRWFPPDELPGDDELAFTVNALVLAAWRQQQSQRAG